MILNFSFLILIDVPLKKKKKPWEFIPYWIFKNSIIKLIVSKILRTYHLLDTKKVRRKAMVFDPQNSRITNG